VFALDVRERVQIIEAYVNYKPEFNYSKIVERLIFTVPDKYLMGLGSIVLCNFSGLPKREKAGKIRRKKNRIKRDEVGGYYQHEWRGQKALIQLFVDKIPMPPRILRWIRPLSDLTFANVLYHELGHHAHKLRPEYGEKEDVAETWRTRFILNHLKKTHYYIYAPLKLVALFLWWIWGKRSKARLR
jgi:hypothetical protein